MGNMRIVKSRKESDELMLFRSLNSRMELETKDMNQFWKLEKGFEGELKFDSLIERLPNDGLIVNDLLLEVSGTLFQIDSLFIFLDSIYLFEIKNFEGDFYIENNIWYTRAGKEIKDPLSQVKRSESLFRRYLQQLRTTFTIKSYLVFVNPEFTLYQAPLNDTIVFPTQLNQLIKNLSIVPSKTYDKHLQLASRILADHQTKSPYTRLPKYSCEQLNKGILCSSCRSIDTYLSCGKLICHDCGFTEVIDSSIVRSTEEYMLLFPDRKLTTNAIWEWCRVVESKKTIRRVMSKNYNMVGHGKASFYISEN